MLIRVAFLINFSDRLLGGLNYFRNLLEAVNSLPEKRIEPVIFTGNQSDLTLAKDFSPVEIIKTGFLSRKTPLWLFHKILQRILPRDILLERLLRKHNISVLSHAGSLGVHSKIKTIGWIPDFQHKHLPDLFSKIELHERDKMHEKLCRKCSCMIVSSYDALNDLNKFYPDCAGRAHVLQFVAGPLSNLNLPSVEEMEEKYGFSGPYFHLPNQFWIHKNHKIVIEALKILKDRGKRTLVIVTGKTSDHRQSEHFDNLLFAVKKYGLADYFRVLEVVPYNDLISLMQNSVALINPSLFEGWSSSVEEAKSLGKRIILSDIPVHKEQDPPGGRFFFPDRAESLADLMREILEERNLDEDSKLLSEAHGALRKRKMAFAERYQDIVLGLLDYSVTN